MLVRKIYISWREKVGSRRYIIARIKRSVTEGISFDYCRLGYDSAKAKGLDYFLGFKDAQKLTPEQLEQLLSLRIISRDRPDRDKYLSFWNANQVSDTFDLLALTQGKSPTDNFEFLAEYYPRKGLSFVTDLAALSHLQLPRGTVSKGDKLNFRPELKNEHDSEAIAVFKGTLKVGYIKQIHTRVFRNIKTRIPTLTVKGVDQNGVIKQIFISVDFL